MDERGLIDRSISSLRTLRRSEDDDLFWFRDDLHQPYPISPLGMTTMQKHHAWSYHHASEKVQLPGSKGAHVKIYKGRVYLGFEVIHDPLIIKKREEKFAQIVDYVIDHWDEWYAEKISKVKAELDNISCIDADRLKLEDLFHYIQRAEAMSRRNWELHFEMMYVADAIYLGFESLCLKYGLGEIDFTTMLKGIGETAALKTDREIWFLAKKAEELGITDIILSMDKDSIIGDIGKAQNGKEWLKRLEDFLKVYGNRISAGHLDIIFQTWRENPIPVLETIQGYIKKMRNGWDFETSRRAIEEEREKAIQNFVAKLPEEEKPGFLRLLKAAQGAYFFQEDHGFYIDAGSNAVLRFAFLAAGRRLQKLGLLNDAEDVFFLTYYELVEVFSDLIREEGPAVYHHKRLVPGLIKERKQDWQTVPQEDAPLTIGAVPETMTDPIGIKVFGVIDEVLHPKGEKEVAEILKGFAGAPGVVEGPARVVLHFDGFAAVEPGEILVCPYTSTAWTPLFAKIGGVVTDTGGMLTHAAIAAREYGIPAVVGTWNATHSIKDGDIIRVDGSKGDVKVLKRAG